MRSNNKLIRIFAVGACAAVAAFGLICCNGSDVDGKAAVTSWEVPDKYRAERTEGAGEVVSMNYTAHDYALGTLKEETKSLNVYLPYGYDESEHYNIVYLLHGTDPQTVVHQNTWLYTVGVKNVLDNLIYYGDIEPVIVVTPTFYSYGLYGDDDMKGIKDVSPVKRNSSDNFVKELRLDIIPAVESKYSTFADNVDEAGLVASRDHRAMAGLSNGCRITLAGGMVENFDYISWFGCYSSSIDSELITTALDSDRFSGFKLNYMFNADGIYDFAYNSHKKMYDELLKHDKFDENNTEYVKINFGYHSARSWRVGFYDSMLRFFK